jgi:hypothetical protein
MGGKGYPPTTPLVFVSRGRAYITSAFENGNTVVRGIAVRVRVARRGCATLASSMAILILYRGFN